jgi:NAD(P)-dependent dehydrogenase (short-subunit alcohol dehydrogenase family)
MLTNRRILITGAARGLGRTFAEGALAAGAKVVIADILEAEGRATADALGVPFVPLDLAAPESVSACAAAAADALGGLDGLVNNGAITNSGGRMAEDLDIATWDRVMDVNVRGTWLMTLAALPHLRRSGAGRVVNLASDTALWGAPKLLAYVASKGAVIAMTRSLAREFGEDGITVNAVAPGLTLVEATQYVPEARHRFYAEGRAIKRAQQPEDVSGTVLFLLSDAAAFVTGQVIPVNGGFVMN